MSNPAFAALIWWLVPIIGVTGAIIYVVWVSKFQDKFENQTNRSVGKFQAFQDSFDRTSHVKIVEEERALSEKPQQTTEETPPERD